ncbi:hypothetical protein [Arthrobacter psychrolactophilus]
MSLAQPEGGNLTAKRWSGVIAALGAGIGAGLLGPSLHGHAWFTSGAVIPYGAALALLLVAAVSIFVALWSKKSWNAVWCGAAAYATAGLLSLQLGSFGLIFDNTQGRIWLYGIAVIAPLTGWLAWLILRGHRRRD